MPVRERFEAQYIPQKQAVYLKHYYNLSEPLKNGDDCALSLYELKDEAAFDLAQQLLAAYDKMQDQ